MKDHCSEEAVQTRKISVSIQVESVIKRFKQQEHIG